MKQTVLKIAKACGLFAACRLLTRKHLRILCYHGIWLGDAPHFGDCLYMSADTFRRRMDLLERAGYPVLGLDDAVARLQRGTLPDAAVVITIDDAWYGTGRHMLPLLSARGLPATLYVTTYYALARRPVLNVMINFMVSRATARPPLDTLLAASDEGESANAPNDAEAYASALAARVDALPTLDARWQAVEHIAARLGADLDTIDRERWFHLMTEEELRAAAAAGIDIQLHTHSHRMHDFDSARVRAEVERNREELARILGRDGATFNHFCYPSGVHNPSVYAVLRAAGVKSATTTEFGLNPPGANPMELRRILDCQSMSDLDIEARLSGFWGLLSALKRRLQPGAA